VFVDPSTITLAPPVQGPPAPPAPLASPAPPAPPAPPKRRRPARAAVTGAGAVLALAASARLPWEWSLIDDGSLLSFTDRHVAAHGRLGALVPAAVEWYHTDRAWGLFRPAFWATVAVFYQLPVGAAHAVRLAMLAVVLAAAVVTVTRGVPAGPRRTTLAVWTGLAVAAAGPIFAGIWYPSLQELSGLCAVGFGLLAWRRPWAVAGCFTVAAWFKSPFAWLLIAFGLLVVWRRGSRASGAVAVALGVVTVALAAQFARTGTYTTWLLAGRFDNLDGRAVDAAHALARPMLVVAAGATLLLPRPRWRPDPDSPQWPLLLGGLGYLASLMAWRTDGYYAAPYAFLLTVGVLAALRDIRPLSRTRLAAALVVPLLIAGHGVSRTARTGWDTHRTTTGLRDCVLGLPPGSVVGFNRNEGWARLDQIAHRRRPGWTGRVVYVPDGRTAGETFAGPEPHLDYYIHQPGYGPGTPALRTGAVVCRTPFATVYRI
jgi:hypothetical protein